MREHVLMKALNRKQPARFFDASRQAKVSKWRSDCRERRAQAARVRRNLVSELSSKLLFCRKAARWWFFRCCFWIAAVSRNRLRACCSKSTGVIRRAATAMRFRNAKDCSAALSLKRRNWACVCGHTEGKGEVPLGRQPERPFRKWNLSMASLNFDSVRVILLRLRRFFAVINFFRVHAQSYHTRGRCSCKNWSRSFLESFFSSFPRATLKESRSSAKKKYTPVGDSCVCVHQFKGSNHLARLHSCQLASTPSGFGHPIPLCPAALPLLFVGDCYLLARARFDLAFPRFGIKKGSAKLLLEP